MNPGFDTVVIPAWRGALNFQLNFRKIVIVLFLLGLPLLSINMQRNPGETPWYIKPFAWTFSSLHMTYASFSESVRETANLYLNLWQVKRQNLLLAEENRELKARQTLLSELQLENDRLRGLLEFKQKSQMDLVAAQVIGYDLIGDRDTIQLNRGGNDGIKPGQAVISIDGAVGYILHSRPMTSQVLVLTDRYAVLDATVQRSRARGIVEGTNKGFGQLKHLERADDVRVGDLVVTSGLGNIFPKGFPIGVVTQVKKSQYGVSQEVDLKPVIQPKQLEEVFVIQNAAFEEFINSSDAVQASADGK